MQRRTKVVGESFSLANFQFIQLTFKIRRTKPFTLAVIDKRQLNEVLCVLIGLSDMELSTVYFIPKMHLFSDESTVEQ